MKKSVNLYLLTFTVKAAPPQKIVRGSKVQRHENWYMAQVKIGDTHMCGATIISIRHILTAAHCVWYFRDSPNAVKIITNSISLYGTNGKVHQVEKVAVHDKYMAKPDLHHDIAIITVSEFNKLKFN